MSTRLDAAIVGGGPNGLAAAIVLAQAGRSVTVYEAAEKAGGGARSAELTLPGFVHDVCSAIHPLALSSPFLRTLPLAQHGLDWVFPEIEIAHPLDDGTAVLVRRSVADTAAELGGDARAYRSLLSPFVGHWSELMAGVLGPVLRMPRHPMVMARFGRHAVFSAGRLITSQFDGERARAVMAGMAAHGNLPLDARFSGSFGLVLAGGAHAVGWPVARGGSQAIADAMTAYLESMGGNVVTGQRIASLDDLPDAKAVLFDLTPRQIETIAAPRLKRGKARAFARFRHGAAVFKVDYALSGPPPWTAPGCDRTATLHLGGTFEEIAASEQAVAAGRIPEKPYVIVAQQSVIDPSRAPGGRHTLWAYCHVPPGCEADMTGHIEAQIERFAPGFRDLVLARHCMGPAALQRYNENYIGGDISGGALDGLQLLLRPGFTPQPYTIGDGLYLCSSSAPPGPGVHGMSGYHAAQAALHGTLRS